MKKALTASVASLLALAAVQTASADVTVYLTGSTAFRAATHNAIKNVMSFGAGQGYGYGGSSFTGSNHAIFKGTITGVPGVVTIKTGWSGSVAGVRDVVQGNNVGFLPDSTAISAAGTGGANEATGNLVNAIPQIAMSDTFQSSTKYPSSPSLVENIVGIVPFAWVASKDAPAGMTNMTGQLARALFQSGLASAALWTNNNADASDQVGGTYVYAAGRDPFSGTRLTAFAESGVGVNTNVFQYEPTGAITSNVLSQIRITQPNAEVPDAGNNGFSSGGSLADIMRYSTLTVEDTNNDPGGANRKICFVTYLGEGDAARAVNGTGSAVTGGSAGNARYLNFNGVAGFAGIAASFTNVSTNGTTTITLTGTDTTAGLVAGQAIKGTNIPVDATIASITDATHLVLSTTASGTSSTGTASTTNLLPNNIRNGSYTFWGYEHVLYKTSLTGDSLSVAQKIRDQIKNVDFFASGLADNAAMRVLRTTDGGTVLNNY